MKYIVYKIVNNVNGKFYIGVHKTNNVDDSYFGSGLAIKRAIEKYGKECFTKHILHIFDNPKEAFDKEKELVVLSESSYNLKEGGCGGFDYINKLNQNPTHTSKHSRYMHDCLKQKLKANPEFAANYKQNKSKAAKRAINQDPILKQRLLDQLSLFRNNVCKDETKIKISNSMKGKRTGGNNLNAKAVSVNGNVYECFRAAKDALSIADMTLRKRLKSEKYPDWFYI